MTENSWYWSVDMVGLDSAGARLVSKYAEKEGLCLVACPVDPAIALNLILDHVTAAAILDCLRPVTDLNAIAYMLEEWLKATGKNAPSLDD